MRVISVIEDSEIVKKILQRRTSPQALETLGNKDLPAVCLAGLITFREPLGLERLDLSSSTSLGAERPQGRTIIFMWTLSISPRRRLYEPEARDLPALGVAYTA